MRTITKTLCMAVLAVFSLTMVSCGDDDVAPSERDTNQIPTPADADGVLVGIKTFTTVEAGGFVTDVEFGTAVAVFIDGSNFLSAGDVTANGEVLTKNSNNSYTYIPDLNSPAAATGIMLGNETTWTVSGEGNVPAINTSLVGFPSKPNITSATTIDISTDYNFTWNSVSGADSLIVSVYGNNSNATKTVAGNATSVTFSSNDLSNVGKTDFGIIQVAAYKQEKQVISGSNIYVTNETVGSETNVTIQ